MADRRYRQTAITVAVAAALVFGGAGGAHAVPDPPTDGEVGGEVNQGQDQIDLGALSSEQLNSFQKEYYLAIGKPPKPPYKKFAATTFCTPLPPDADGWDVLCQAMTDMCKSFPAPKGGGTAEAWRVWSRRVNERGEPVTEQLKPEPNQRWVNEGFTCYRDAIPGVGNTLTISDVVKRFNATKFARPDASIQPKGNVTLVSLPTYLETAWPEAGFAPDEIDSVELLGRSVQIKPTLKSINYIYGDGSESGPTLSLGGAYPNGDIIHTYRSPQTVAVRVDVTYGGKFSVDGSKWIDIPGEATVEGTPQILRVAEAKARLYTN